MTSVQAFLKKMQSLPEFQRKIIVWGATILIGIGLFAWWISRMQQPLEIQQGLQEQFKGIPIQRDGNQ